MLLGWSIRFGFWYATFVLVSKLHVCVRAFGGGGGWTAYAHHSGSRASLFRSNEQQRAYEVYVCLYKTM